MLENNSSETSNYKIHDHRPKHEAQADLTHKLKLTQNNEYNNYSELNFKIIINIVIVYNKQKGEYSGIVFWI